MDPSSPDRDATRDDSPAPAPDRKRFVAPRLTRHDRLPAITGFSGFFPEPPP